MASKPRYEPFLAVPVRVFRAFRAGEIDRDQWHLLVDLSGLAAQEDYSLVQPLHYSLHGLADVLHYPLSESKLRKDLKALDAVGYLELVPGAKARMWRITI